MIIMTNTYCFYMPDPLLSTFYILTISLLPETFEFGTLAQ